MAPLVVLVVVTGLARVTGALGVAYVGTWADALAVGLAAMFLLTASAHVIPARRAGLVAIVPPRLPRPDVLVTVTGVLEAAGAAGLLVPPSLLPGARATAAFCLALLMVAMFPANVYAAGARRHPAAPHTPLALRTVLQLIFLAAAVAVALMSLR